MNPDRYLTEEPPVTFLDIHAFEKSYEELDKTHLSEEDALIMAGRNALQLLNSPIHSVAKSKAFLDSIQKAYKDLRKTEEVPKARKEKKNSFGKTFFEWMKKMDNFKCCQFCADYDPVKTKHLFTEVDCREVMASFESKSSLLWINLVSGYEACVFGFGGSMSGGGSTNEEITNLMECGEEGLNELRDIMGGSNGS